MSIQSIRAIKEKAFRHKPILFKNYRFIIGFLAILVAAVGLSYLFWIQQTQFKPQDFKIVNNDPDFLVGKAAYYKFSQATGQLEFELKARELRHYEALKRTEFDIPVFVVFDESNEAWNLNAEFAWMLHFNQTPEDADQTPFEQKLSFENNVILRTNGPSQLQLNTSSLNINPRLQTIETKSHVQIISPQFNLSSDGFKTNMNEGTLQLNNKVNVTYSPNNQFYNLTP